VNYQNLAARTLRKFKNLLIKPGSQPTQIKFGLAKGISMQIDPTCNTQRLYGLYEREIAREVRQYALKANTIVDVGVHDGYYTTAFSVLNPKAIVFACEPEQEFKQKCLKNLSLNRLSLNGRVSWIPKFIGLESQDNFISLDTLLKESQEPIFIKMDIDGGELEALHSGTEVLKNKTCLLIVETHSQELENECISYLTNLGYQCQIVPNAWWRIFIPELRPIEHNRWFSARKVTSIDS
jgi:hypothetical protein